MFSGGSERRLVRREALTVPILVWGTSGQPDIHGVTRDVSTIGVFFFVQSWRHDLEVIEFLLILPPSATSLAYEVGLFCRGKVIRVEEPRADGAIGIAAEIEDYRLSTMRLAASGITAREWSAGWRTICSFAMQQLRRVGRALGIPVLKQHFQQR